MNFPLFSGNRFSSHSFAIIFGSGNAQSDDSSYRRASLYKHRRPVRAGGGGLIVSIPAVVPIRSHSKTLPRMS
jgi:hypothetical protein